jgi:hypothetical protein
MPALQMRSSDGNVVSLLAYFPAIAGAKPPNKALQTDKGNLSCLLRSQKSRQLAFAAELGR